MDFFYGDQSEFFSFYRIPKRLITDKRFKSLFCEAKLLYGLLIDRMSLSKKNEWMDKQRRIYIYYTIENIMEDLGCGHEKAGKLLADLEKHQLLYKVRQGLGKPDRLYPLQFLKIQTSENQISGDLIFGSLEVRNSDANKTDRN